MFASFCNDQLCMKFYNEGSVKINSCVHVEQFYFTFSFTLVFYASVIFNGFNFYSFILYAFVTYFCE